MSPLVVYIYMEYFIERALKTAQNPARLWKRFVYDIFVIQHIEHKKFLQHINNIDTAIQLTVEDTWPDVSMPFLDTLVILDQNGSLATRVYTKPTATDQYLQWGSHHDKVAKYSVINSLTPKLLRAEVEHRRDVLTKCKYLVWVLGRMEHTNFQQKSPNNENTTNTTNNKGI